MNGRANREKIRLRESADDLGMTVDELTVKLNRLDTLWPCADELCVMLDWLSEPEGQDRLALKVRQAITDGYVEGDERLVNRVEQIEDRMYMQNVQIEHDAASRAQGEVSLG